MTVITGIPDEPLAAAVALAASGDEAAFASIVGAHHRDMTRVAALVCGDLDLADEAVAAAWAIAWRKLGGLKDPERLRPWLVSVAANEARQLVRRQRRRTVREIPVDDSMVGRGADPALRAADLDLANALARLSPDDRALLSLRYVAGLDSTGARACHRAVRVRHPRAPHATPGPPPIGAAR